MPIWCAVWASGQVLRQQRGLAAGQAGGSGRHHGGRLPISRRSSAAMSRGVGEALGATPAGTPGPTLQFMMSSGGMTAAEKFPGQGCDPVRSGGGASSAMVATAATAGFGRVIGFDMGGTSTGRGALRRRLTSAAFDTEVAGVRIRAPMMRLPHGGGGRRVDPARRSGPLPRSGRIRRAPIPARPANRARRAADGDRCQCHAGQKLRPEFLSPRLRPRSGCASRRRCGCGPNSPPSPRREGKSPEEVGRGLPDHRDREHGQTRSRRSRSSAAMT